MTNAELNMLKSYCCDRLRLYHERSESSKKRYPYYNGWYDGIYEGARTISGDIVNFLQQMIKDREA